MTADREDAWYWFFIIDGWLRWDEATAGYEEYDDINEDWDAIGSQGTALSITGYGYLDRGCQPTLATWARASPEGTDH